MVAQPQDHSDPLPGTVFNARQVRLLRIAVIVMGVMLVGGFAFVLSAIVYQASHITQRTAPSARLEQPSPAGAVAPEALLPLKRGQTVSHIALDGTRMAVHLTGRSGREIAVIDLMTGKVISRVLLKSE